MNVLLTLLLVACGTEGPTLAGGSGGGTGGGDEDRCPADMTEIVQDRAELGEWDKGVEESYPGTVIGRQPYDLDAYCIGTYPLPGTAGREWPTDGLSVDQLPEIEALLAAHGRRLCTVGELLYAAASEDNWRHPYDPEERQALCDPDDGNPSPLGTFPQCSSPLGVRDFEVRSTWALLDSVTRSAVEGEYPWGLPADGRYAAWGGTSRTDTYYAPSNFGVHFHEEGDEAYLDDGLRVCADHRTVDSEVEAAWSELASALVEAGSFAAWLDGSTGAGTDTGTDTGR